MSTGSSACHIAISRALDIELYISEDKPLFNSLLQHKDEIEAETGLQLDWRKLPEKKASHIIIEKPVNLTNQDEWNSQFEWIMDVALKMKTAFKKYL